MTLVTGVAFRVTVLKVIYVLFSDTFIIYRENGILVLLVK